MTEILIAFAALTVGTAVVYGWRQEAPAKYAQEVADLGRQLYERIAVLAGHWGVVGNRLDKAIEPVERTARALQAGEIVALPTGQR